MLLTRIQLSIKGRFSNSRIDNNFSILCIGIPKVGKHTFIKRFSENIFDETQLSPRTKASRGEIPVKSIEFLSLLDKKQPLAAAEMRVDRYKSKLSETKPPSSKTLKYNLNNREITLVFKYLTDFDENAAETIKTIDGFMFLFSAVDEHSFAKCTQLLSLFDDVRKSNQKYPGALVATMSDYPSTAITNEQIQRIASGFDIPYHMTSARTGDGVRESVEDILQQIEFYRIHLRAWKNISNYIKNKMSMGLITKNSRRVKTLIQTGKSPSAKDKSGWAPIHVACWEGNLESVFMFVQFEPKCVNTLSDTKWTPLHCAARCGHARIVQFLINSAADVLLPDSTGLDASSTPYLKVRQILGTAQAARIQNSKIRKQSQISAATAAAATTKLLDMSFSKLIQFPDIIFEHTHLVEISLISNFIKEIPNNICDLKNLKKLSLANNIIESLPETISQLNLLRFLDVRSNKLTTLNTTIGDMKSLKMLLLGHNMLSFLPTQLSILESTLEVFDIEGNPLGTIPSDILPAIGEFKPQSNLFTYLKNLAAGDQVEYNRVKIMFVGDGNVGKTSLINCFLSQDTPTRTSRLRSRGSSSDCVDTIATDGIDIHELTVPLSDTQEMTWDCWDYAGQEIYYSTHQFFLSPRSVYLICYNLLDRNFSKIEYWLNSIHTRARGSPIFLVGTHVDDREVTQEYIEEFISSMDKAIKLKRFKSVYGVRSIRGMHTVGSRKRLGIKELMGAITAEVQRCKYVGKLYPQNWIKVESTLSVMRQQKTKPVINFDEFKRIALGCQIEGESVIDVARFLHQAGVLCYFENGSEKLRNLIILDPQFLTRVMSAVITIRHRYGQDQSNPGILTPSDLPHVWSKFPVDMRDSLMQLLEQFEIAFKVPQLGCIILPSLLPAEQPDIKPYWSVFMNQEASGHVFGRTYSFEFLPLGFFPRLFIRNYHLPDFEVIAKWRYGQILKYKNIVALFRYNPSTFILKLEVHGKYAASKEREFQDTIKVLRILLETIETTIEGWYETKTSVTIPCSHCLIRGGYSNWEFSLQECMHNISSGKGYALCRNVRKVRLDFLAPDLSFTDLESKSINYEDLVIGDVIGVGAFGTVTKGLFYGKEVAIKELTFTNKPQDISLSDEDEQPEEEMKSKFSEFQREVWIMSCLNHSCVCGLVGVSMKPMAIVMEYLAHGDMYHMFDDFLLHSCELQEKLMSFPFKLLLVYDIARGMEHLHGFEPPIIHRDLRSPNIFVAELSLESESRVKVGDFGLSRLVAPTLHGGEFNQNWLAPEVMKSDQYTGKIDIYSFGIIMWEIMTLEKPFEEYDSKFAGKPASMFKSAVIDGLRPSIRNRDTFNSGYIELMENCWHDDPNERPEFSVIVEILCDLLVMNNVNFGPAKNKKKLKLTMDKSYGSSPKVRVQRKIGESHGTVFQGVNAVSFFKRLNPKHSHSILAICPSINKKFVWSATASGDLLLWDAATLELDKLLRTSKKRFYCLCATADTMWAGCDDGTISIYAAKSLRKLYGLTDHGKTIRALLYTTRSTTKLSKGKTQSENIMYSADGDGNLFVWLLRKKHKPKLKQKVKIAQYIGAMIIFKNYLCVGTEKNVLLLDQTNFNVIKEWQGHSREVNCLVNFDNEVWSGSGDSTIRVWNESSDVSSHTLTAHTGKVLSITKTENYVWSGAFDTAILVWNTDTKLLIQELRGEHTDAVRSMICHQEFVWTGSAELDGHICLWKATK